MCFSMLSKDFFKAWQNMSKKLKMNLKVCFLLPVMLIHLATLMKIDKQNGRIDKFSVIYALISWHILKPLDKTLFPKAPTPHLQLICSCLFTILTPWNKEHYRVKKLHQVSWLITIYTPMYLIYTGRLVHWYSTVFYFQNLKCTFYTIIPYICFEPL